MKITETLAKNLLNAFEGNNWTDVSIKDTLAGLSWQQVTTQTPASPNTIASLVNHLWYWNTIIMERMKGNYPNVPETNGFDVSELHDDADWQILIKKTHQSFINLANAIRQFPEEKLMETPKTGASTINANLFGIVEHAYYHLGQIVIVKHLV